MTKLNSSSKHALKTCNPHCTSMFGCRETTRKFVKRGRERQRERQRETKRDKEREREEIRKHNFPYELGNQSQ